MRRSGVWRTIQTQYSNVLKLRFDITYYLCLVEFWSRIASYQSCGSKRCCGIALGYKLLPNEALVTGIRDGAGAVVWDGAPDVAVMRDVVDHIRLRSHLFNKP